MTHTLPDSTKTTYFDNTSATMKCDGGSCSLFPDCIYVTSKYIVIRGTNFESTCWVGNLKAMCKQPSVMPFDLSMVEEVCMMGQFWTHLDSGGCDRSTRSDQFMENALTLQWGITFFLGICWGVALCNKAPSCTLVMSDPSSLRKNNRWHVERHSCG